MHVLGKLSFFSIDYLFVHNVHMKQPDIKTDIKRNGCAGSQFLWSYSVGHPQWVGAQVTVAAITLEEWGERGVNMEWELRSGGEGG